MRDLAGMYIQRQREIYQSPACIYKGREHLHVRSVHHHLHDLFIKMDKSVTKQSQNSRKITKQSRNSRKNDRKPVAEPS